MKLKMDLAALRLGVRLGVTGPCFNGLLMCPWASSRFAPTSLPLSAECFPLAAVPFILADLCSLLWGWTAEIKSEELQVKVALVPFHSSLCLLFASRLLSLSSFLFSSLLHSSPMFFSSTPLFSSPLLSSSLPSPPLLSSPLLFSPLPSSPLLSSPLRSSSSSYCLLSSLVVCYQRCSSLFISILIFSSLAVSLLSFSLLSFPLICPSHGG